MGWARVRVGYYCYYYYYYYYYDYYVGADLCSLPPLRIAPLLITPQSPALPLALRRHTALSPAHALQPHLVRVRVRVG